MQKLISFILLAGLALAQGKAPVEPVFKDGSGLALKGYDPVSYFTANKAMKGSSEFTHQHMGVTYRFASAANRDLFAKEPGKYLPEYGGYCAWAVGHNYTAPADPEAWKIVNGKLYLNYNKDVQKKWMAEEASLIQKGDSNWPKLHK